MACESVHVRRLRAGIIDLLDKLRPPGEIITPPPGPEEERWVDWDEEGNEGSAGYLWQFTFPDSPEEYAQSLVRGLIIQAHNSEQHERARMKIGIDNVRTYWEDSPRGPELMRSHYGFVDAHRDLNLTTKRMGQK